MDRFLGQSSLVILSGKVALIGDFMLVTAPARRRVYMCNIRQTLLFVDRIILTENPSLWNPSQILIRRVRFVALLQLLLRQLISQCTSHIDNSKEYGLHLFVQITTLAIHYLICQVLLVISKKFDSIIILLRNLRSK